MARSVEEWIGKNDDDWPSGRRLIEMTLRVIERSNGKCALCGRTFDLKLRPQLDHVRNLKSGKLYPGENLNRESNLQALCGVCHGTIKTPRDQKEIAEIKRYERKLYDVKSAKEKRKRPIPRRPKMPRVKTAWWTQISSGETDDGT